MLLVQLNEGFTQSFNFPVAFAISSWVTSIQAEHVFKIGWQYLSFCPKFIISCAACKRFPIGRLSGVGTREILFAFISTTKLKQS